MRAVIIEADNGILPVKKPMVRKKMTNLPSWHSANSWNNFGPFFIFWSISQ